MIAGEVKNANAIRGFLEKSGLSSSDSYLVKPNWFFQSKGFYTDAKTLELLLECLDKVTIIESYTYQRNDGTRTITPENGKLYWDWIRKQDKKFLPDTGLDHLLRQYNVEYVNLTEEVWAERIANPDNVQRSVEAAFPPVWRKELYEQVPERIYAMRGRKLISFAKLKQQTTNRVSATLKSMFGNIIDPNRILHVAKLHQYLFALDHCHLGIQLLNSMQEKGRRTVNAKPAFFSLKSYSFVIEKKVRIPVM